ncbi:hypothetical protein CEXT_235461 [Caerostris extrusa]|uniref:Uncharacterized protein n=1 Tax=Caerostris extrusa TaxID=172846 RepID=A0AAV4PLL3_CAEEX|nr:hypothetical protein CEXT_235461 [Caerostris extrusa]
MLLTLPQLVSLGLTDSSWAAHHINTQCRFQTVPRFCLKECFWGFNRNANIEIDHHSASHKLPGAFKKLRHLRVLNINFNLCRGSPTRTAFISLLRNWVFWLQRLTIVSWSTMPVDVVMKYCPNLVRLDLCCVAIVQGGIETDSKNFRQLKRLIVAGVDKESLEYLLRNCVNLKELLLYDAHCLTTLCCPKSSK